MEPNTTREKIMLAAIDIFIEKGFVDATVDQITQAAGVSHGTFYIYFKNKREVLWEAVQETFNKLYLATQEPWIKGDVKTSLEQSIGGWFKIQTENWKIVRTWKEVAHVDNEFKESWDQLASKITGRIEENIKKSIRNSICRKVNPEVAANALSGMIEHYISIVMYRKNDIDIVEIVQTIADLWYHSLYVLTDAEG